MAGPDSPPKDLHDNEGPDDPAATSDKALARQPTVFTIDDLMRESDGPRDWRQFPRLLIASLRLCRQAAPRELLVAGGLQLFNGLSTFALLLIGRAALDALLAESASFASMAPSVLALVVVAALQRFAAVAEQEQGELLRELVSQHTESQVLDVAARVDLADFESPEFFNRLQRASMGSGVRTTEMIYGLFGLARSGAGAAGAIGVLLVIEPLLVP